MNPDAKHCIYCGAAINVIGAQAAERIASSTAATQAGVDEILRHVQQLSTSGATGGARFSQGKTLNPQEYSLLATAGDLNFFGKFMTEASKQHRLEFLMVEGESVANIGEMSLLDAWQRNPDFRWHGGYVMCPRCGKRRHIAAFRRPEELMVLSENRHCPLEQADELVDLAGRNLQGTAARLQQAEAQGEGLFGMGRGAKIEQVAACRRLHSAAQQDFQCVSSNRDFVHAHAEDQPSFQVAERMAYVLPPVTSIGSGQCRAFDDSYLM